MIEIPKQDPRAFCRYLGYSDGDMKPAGNRAVNIICPFHDDRNPSMTVYEDGCYCNAQCGDRHGKYDFIDLVMKVKGLDFKEAMKELNAKSDDFERDYQSKCYVVPKKRFVGEEDKYSNMDKQTILKNALIARYEACSEVFDEKMVDWLSKKKLSRVARNLGFKWHPGGIIKFRKEGIVFPYFDPITHELESLRMREWNEDEKKFDKVKGLKGLEPIPYKTTFRPNSVVFIAEGESSPASLYAHGCSAIGVPGAGQKKAINSAVEWLGTLPYVKTIIACGDNDEAGRNMNMLIRSAAHTLAPHLYVAEYKPDTQEAHADVNDDHVNDLLKIPVQFTANYGGNYDRQPWANKDLLDAINMVEESEKNGATWEKYGNIYILKDKDGQEVKC